VRNLATALLPIAIVCSTFLEEEGAQVGRTLEQLGVTYNAALSPQAKGRIERLWGTFQGRLTSELRLARGVQYRSG
jgi:hypothetical protein